MRLLDYLAPLYNALIALNPAAPKVAFVALVFLIVMAWRRWFPASWVAYSGMVAKLLGITDDDTNKFKELLMHALQGIPAAVIGGVLAVIGTGGDIKASVGLALVALFAPLGHFLMSRYKGKLGTVTGKLPPAGGEKPVAPLPPWNDSTPASLPGAKLVGLGLVVLLTACSVAPKLEPRGPDDPCTPAQHREAKLAYEKDVHIQCAAFDVLDECPAYLPLKAEFDKKIDAGCQ